MKICMYVCIEFLSCHIAQNLSRRTAPKTSHSVPPTIIRMKRRLPLVLAVTVTAASSSSSSSSSSSLRGVNQVAAITGEQSGTLTNRGGIESGLRRPIQLTDSSSPLLNEDDVRLLASNDDDGYVASSTADDDSVSIYDAHGDDDRVAKYVSMIQNWETTAISKFHDFESTANTTAWEFYESPPSSWTQQQWDLVIDLLIGLFVFVSLSLICFVNCCCAAAQDEQDKGFSPPTSPTMYEGKPFSPAASAASQDSQYFDQRSFLASSRGSFLGRLMSTVTPKATGRSKKYSVSPSPRNRRPSRSRSRHRSAVRGGRGMRGNSRSGRRSRRSMSFDDSETILSSEYEDDSTVDSRSESSYEPPESRSSFWSKASNSITLDDDSCSYDEDETNAGSVELSRSKNKPHQKRPLPDTITHDRSKSMANTVVSDITKETATMGSLSLQASSTRTMTPLNQLPEEEPQQETEVAIDQTSSAMLKTANVVAVHAVDMKKPTNVVTDETNDNTSAISTKSQKIGLVTDIRHRLNSKESCSKESNSSMSSKDSTVIRQRSSSERFKFDDIVRPSLSSFKMPGEWKKKKPTALVIDSNINDGMTKMTMKGGGGTFTDAAPMTTVNTSSLLSPIIDETPRASDTLIHVDGRDHIVSEGIEVPTRRPSTSHKYISTQKESETGSTADHIARIDLPSNPTTFDGSVKTAKVNNKSSKDVTTSYNNVGKSGTDFIPFTRNELTELRQQSVNDSNNNTSDSQKERVGSPYCQREKVAAASAEKINGTDEGGMATTKAVVLEELVRDVLTSTRNLDMAIAGNNNKSRIRSSSKSTRRRVLVDEVTRRRRNKEKELRKNDESKSFQI